MKQKSSLREILIPVNRLEEVVDDKVYPQVGVRVWGKGAYAREEIIGKETSYKTFSKVKAGDVIINKIWARNGSLAIVENDLNGMYCSVEFPLFEIDKSKSDIDWVRILLKSPHLWHECAIKSGGTSGKNRLKPENFLDIEIILPSKEEQQAIVNKIKNLQETISALDHKLNYLEEDNQSLRDSILDYAVRGKLVPQNPNDEPTEKLLERIKVEKKELMKEGKLRKEKPSHPIDPGEIPINLPEGWGVERLGSICRFIDYRGKTPQKVDSGVRLITAKNIKFGHMSLTPEEFMKAEDYEQWMTRGFPENGDILFTTEAPLGNLCLYDFGGDKIALAQRIITLHPYSNFDGKFLLYALMSNILRKQIFERQSGMTAKGVKSRKLKEIVVPIPPLTEQKKIVERVDMLMQVCKKQEKNIIDAKDKLDQLNKVMLREMFE